MTTIPENETPGAEWRGRRDLDRLFVRRFIDEVDRLKIRVDETAETVYIMRRDVAELTTLVKAMRHDDETPVRVWGRSLIVVSLTSWLWVVGIMASAGMLLWYFLRDIPP